MIDEIPAFMMKDRHLGREASLRDDLEFWIARALLIGQYRFDPDRLEALLMASEFAKVGPNGWHDLAHEYPGQALPQGDVTKYQNEDVPVRAFILKQAILALFRLHGASASMKADLAQLLDSFLVNPAVGRAKAQAARLANPHATWSDLEKHERLQLPADARRQEELGHCAQP